MRVYRYEHDRTVCTKSEYRFDGPSLTGHGTYMACPSASDYERRPKFGLNRSAPRAIMTFERVGVTALQFRLWQSPSFTEDKVPGWDLIAYDLADSQEDIDWRESNDQICFNPAFAVRIGPVTVADVREAARQAVHDEIRTIVAAAREVG